MIPIEYDLFISYVRRDVTLVADSAAFDVVAELKRALEQHRRPKGSDGPSRRFRVCTDLDDFAVEGTFDEVMRARIGGSRSFLLIATPGVLSSPYVQREMAIARTVPHVRPMGAVLSARPADVAPGLFSPDEVAADLAAPEGAARRQWRALLRRESHKIVARAWQLPLRDVHDRFEADRRRTRQNIRAAVAGVVVLVVGLVFGLAGELAFHRVATLVQAEAVVSPDGVGFGSDAHTPILVNDREALVWTNGIDHPPVSRVLPFSVLHAVDAGPGAVAVAGFSEAARVDVSANTTSHRWQSTAQLETVAVLGNRLVVTTKDGEAVVFDERGAAQRLPRPVSVAGRRFSAFREKGPLEYGDLLAMAADRFLASVTPTGRLAILDLETQRFVHASEPQFPLAAPIEAAMDPVLYETENTRPIGAMTFLPDHSLLFSEGAGLRRVDISSGRVVPLTHCAIGLVRQFLVLPDGRTVVAMTNSTFEVLRLTNGRFDHIDCLQRTTLEPRRLPRAALSADGRTILVAFFDSPPELWMRTYRIFGIDLWGG